MRLGAFSVAFLILGSMIAGTSAVPRSSACSTVTSPFFDQSTSALLSCLPDAPAPFCPTLVSTLTSLQARLSSVSSGNSALVSVCNQNFAIPDSLASVGFTIGTDICAIMSQILVQYYEQPSQPGEPPEPGPPVPQPSNCDFPDLAPGQPGFSVPACAFPVLDASGNYDMVSYVGALQNCSVGCQATPQLCAFGNSFQLWWESVTMGYTGMAASWEFNQTYSRIYEESQGPDWTNTFQNAAGAPEQEVVDLSHDRCRTATSPASPGKWSVYAATANPSAAAQLVGGTDVGIIGNAAMVSFAPGIHVQDSGEIKQQVCYHAGGWEAITPPTQEPAADEGEIKSQGHACLIATGIFMASAAATAAAAWFAAPAAPAALGFTVTAAAGVVAACGLMAANAADQGYMQCIGSAYVTWGPSNTFDHTLLSVGPFVVHSHSEGDGENELDFLVFHDGPGYHAGVRQCNNQLQAARLEAYRAYRQWGTTSGNGTSGLSALIHLDPVTPTALALLAPTLQPVANGILYDRLTNSLVIGCGSSACPADVILTLSSCGRTDVVGQGQAVIYQFEGDPACTAVSLTINGAAITVLLPLRIDATFEGAE